MRPERLGRLRRKIPKMKATWKKLVADWQYTVSQSQKIYALIALSPKLAHSHK
jgi:hypothetical protein